MDIEMEEMNGYEATRVIRSLDEPKNRIPIIAITASALKTDIEKCFEAGMNDHIAKPFSPSQLKQKIESIFIKTSV
jgi:CheY-like chemotaxis protein